MSYACPCCGYPGLGAPPYSGWRGRRAIRGIDPPYGKHFGFPSFEVCACCGFEFGNDDDPGTAEPVSFEKFFRDWITSGCEWFDATKRPPNWTLAAQAIAADIPVEETLDRDKRC
jgi:hypothetical protein